jgi:predicted  nucleic acid-binding Zn-ribbon protein
MREVEVIEKEVADAEVALKGMVDELKDFETKARESIAEIQAELKQLAAERVTKAQAVGNPQHLTLYNRVIARFPSDPIVDVVNRESCAGCFMKVGPQVAVQISRGDVVKCPGCGRILKLPEQQ